MLVRLIVSFGVGSIIGEYGRTHGWSNGELIMLCLPVGVLISLFLNLIEGNFHGTK